MSNKTPSPMTLPRSVSAGAGALVIGTQVPSRPGKVQVCPGAVHSVSQQTLSTQCIDEQSLGLLQGPPFSEGWVAVAVADAVRVGVPVCVGVAVGVCVAVLVDVAVAVAVGVRVGVLVGV